MVDSGAAPFGATFDAHGWRSLAPMTHSMSTDVYTSEGLFDFTSDAAVEALKLMKQIMAMANPDILLAGASDGGVNGTPDEVAFAAQRVGYYTKYFNAPLRMAQYWDDPKLLHLAPLPKFANGEGSTVFWTTGCALFKYGKNKEKAAEYYQGADLQHADLEGLDRRHARRRIPASCRPTSRSMRSGMPTSPTGCRRSSSLVRGQLDKAKAIKNHVFGLQQFVIGKPYLGDLPQGRGSRPEGGAAEGGRRGPGRNQARLRSQELCGVAWRRDCHCPRGGGRARFAMLQPIAGRAASTASGPDGEPRCRQGISPWLFLLPALLFFVGYQV